MRNEHSSSTLLGSILVSSTDLDRIRIQTQPSLFCDFWGDKTFIIRWSDSRVQVQVQILAPAGHSVELSFCHPVILLAQSKVLSVNQWQSSWTALRLLVTWFANTACFRDGAGSSCRQLLAVDNRHYLLANSEHLKLHFQKCQNITASTSLRSTISVAGTIAQTHHVKGMSCLSWQRHWIGCCLLPFWTLPVCMLVATLWCDLGCCSQTVVDLKLLWTPAL